MRESFFHCAFGIGGNREIKAVGLRRFRKLRNQIRNAFGMTDSEGDPVTALQGFACDRTAKSRRRPCNEDGLHFSINIVSFAAKNQINSRLNLPSGLGQCRANVGLTKKFAVARHSCGDRVTALELWHAKFLTNR